MTNMTKLMKKLLLGTMTVTTLLATSAGASAATRTTATIEPVQATVSLDRRPVGEVQFNRIHLKRTSSKQIASRVQTTVDASALNLDQRHRDQQLK